MTATTKHLKKSRFAGMILFLAVLAFFPQQIAHSKSPTLGVIRGVVEDKTGKPISGAVITVFREGTDRALKQMVADAEGMFSARFLPGRYSLIAVASGFNTSSSNTVQVARSSEVVYRFNLEPIGSGRTVPEKRRDRSDSKWAIRAAQNRRSVFQLGESPDTEVVAVDGSQDDYSLTEVRGLPGLITQRKASVFEINGGSANFATLYGVSERSNLLFTGQFSRGSVRHSRFDATLSTNFSNRHSLTISSGINQISGIGISDSTQNKFHIRVSDEVRLTEGLLFVIGLDYSRTIDESSNSQLSPKIGIRHDIDSKLRMKANFFSVDPEEIERSRVVNVDGISAVFIETPRRYRSASSRSRRLLSNPNRAEFGIERLIDSRSTIEGTIFIDLVGSNEVSLLGLVSSKAGKEFTETITEGTAGFNVVYSRTISSKLSTSGGYSFGVSPQLRLNPETDSFGSGEKSGFHSFFAQLTSDIGNNTRVRTLVRFSPQATVYSIDPFLGKVMVYDPGVSLFVTRLLPNLGLPIRAEASIDARNIFDLSTETSSDEKTIRLTNHRRTVRGGILVRF